MTSPSISDPARTRLPLLAAILFVSYLCVAIPLPIVPVFVTHLGLGNAWAGLGVGVAFFATIASRGWAGTLTDRRGAKPGVGRGLTFYAAGALVCAGAGLPVGGPGMSLALLVAGRLLVGVGESLVGVGIISWGVALVGPARSGKVIALVGAAIYGALAVGGPLGVGLMQRFGYAGAMVASALLSGLGLAAIRSLEGVPPHPGAVRPSFWRLVGRIWPHGSVVCLQGFGFAGIGAFFVLHFLHQGWAHAGLGLTAFGGGFVLARLLFGNLPDRFGGLRVAMASLAVEALGQALIWVAHDPMLALAGAFLTGLGCSMVFPSMGREVVHLVEPHLRGTALGGYSAFQDLAYGVTGPLAGLLADRAGYGSVFLVGGVAAGLGVGMVAYLRSAAATKTVKVPNRS